MHVLLLWVAQAYNDRCNEPITCEVIALAVAVAYIGTMETAITTNPVGDMLREWRRRRRYSQLGLAADAGISTRHLSFVESGRAGASRDMLIRLAEPLELSLRERNKLLLAGGYAPLHEARALDSDDMAAARTAVQAVLKGHEPFPALAVDQHWTLIDANAALQPLLTDIADHLLQPPINVLRLSLHPGGLAPRIVNLAEWRHHLLWRLLSDANRSGDTALFTLYEELRALPVASSKTPQRPVNAVAVPLILSDPATGWELAFLSTTTVFGTATDITLAELTLECFYPANESTRAILLNGGTQ